MIWVRLAVPMILLGIIGLSVWTTQSRSLRAEWAWLDGPGWVVYCVVMPLLVAAALVLALVKLAPRWRRQIDSARTETIRPLATVIILAISGLACVVFSFLAVNPLASYGPERPLSWQPFLPGAWCLVAGHRVVG